MELLIKNATLSKGGKVFPNGCVISFVTTDTFYPDTKLKIINDGQVHYFNAYQVSTLSPTELLVYAVEVAYWANRLDRSKRFDIRSLIGKTVQVVSDENQIERINEETSWC